MVGASLTLPAEVYTPSNAAAIATLARAIFLCALGCFAVSVSPWYLWWVGALVSGAAMSWLYSVGFDCAQRSFFRYRWANHVVGVACTLLMLRPFSSLRLPRKDDCSALATRLRRIGSCFSIKDLKTLYAEGDWRRTAMPIIDLSFVAVFALVFFPLMLYFLGVGGLIKYWLFPFVDMHVRIGTFTASGVLSRVPYLALFHPEVSPLLPGNVQKLLAFPSYNSAKAHAHILKSTVTPAAASSRRLLRKVCAPIDSIAFGRLGRDTPALIYAVGALIGSFALYHTLFASILLVPTLLLMGNTLLHPEPAVEMKKKNDDHVSTTTSTKAKPAPPADFASKPHWFNRIFLSGMHVLGCYSIYHLIFHFNKTTAIFAFISYHFAAMGITAGAHRFWAHRTYNGTPFMRCMLMIMNLFAAQGSIFKWVRDHRLHHKHVDTDKDPHNSERGFWWSHCGWLMYQKSSEVMAAGKDVYMDDIIADKFVMWQAKNNNWASPFCAFGVPTIIAWFWGDAIGGYFVAGILRYLCTLHATWFVNSIAHLWGSRPYVPTINPRENLFVSLCADGEGWHNYHHAYPYDYSTNEHGVFQWNPTTLFINTCAALGLVSERRRAKLPKPDEQIDLSALPTMSATDLETCGKQCAAILAIDGLVYDLTTFEDNHPAGASILKEQYGKDASEAFNGGAHKHTEVALNLMKAYVVAKME